MARDGPFGNAAMIVGYHTAGLLLHEPCVALRELAQLGFGVVAIRPHPSGLNPNSKDFGERVLRLAATAERLKMSLVLDLDAPFFHDPWRQDGPSLSCPSETERAYDWIARGIEVACELNADLVTFASGTRDTRDAFQMESPEQELDRLAAQSERLLSLVDSQRVRLGLRPRHGDAIATVSQFERLRQWVGPESELSLAADVGEMLLGGEFPVADRLGRNLDTLACVYLCDRKAGIAGDQPFGTGDVALGRILRSLRAQSFSGPAIFRVEGHSELGLAAAQTAIAAFEEAVPAVKHDRSP
jgi:sugar phosphate isomerase/epimerase